MKGKRGSHQERVEKKCTTIAHAIMAAVRPQSFQSSACSTLGIAVYLHRKFKSRSLVTVLSNLELCASYDEALIFERSASLCPPESVDANAFLQYSFDNADFNACTLDGLNTIVKAVTRKSAVQPLPPIQRMKRPTKEEMAAIQTIQIAPCVSLTDGLGKVKVADINQLLMPCSRVGNTVSM